MKKLSSLILLGFCTLFAQKPDGSEVEKVLTYYNRGDEAVIVKQIICKDIIREGDEKNNCAEELDASQIKKGTKAYLWLNVMVPQGLELTLSTEFTSDNKVIHTKESNVSGSLRYRTWMSLPTGTAGAINISINQEKAGKFITIGADNYTVVE